jgi:hypothetical protein
MCILNCAANEFAEVELGRESGRGKCEEYMVKYWYRVVSLDVGDELHQSCEWQKSNNTSVRCWIMELTDELYSFGLAFVWTKQQECNLR